MIRTKTLFHRLVAALLVFTATISSALAADSGTGWSYDSGTNTLTLSGSEVDWTAIKDFSSTTEHVLFAEDYAVSSLPDEAFSNFSNLQSIDIPNVVTSIGYRAFYYCTSLTSVTLPQGLTSINRSFFYNCTSLASISIPEGVTSIGNYAFGACKSLTSITIPEGVTSIGSNAFFMCTSLASVSLPEGLLSIDGGAFYDCISLTSITLPSSLTSIGRYTFSGCTTLSSVTLPEGLTSISNGAFNDCSSLSSITLPASVTSIGNEAFNGCSSLNTVEILSNGTSDDKHVIYLGGSDKTATGSYVFEQYKATLVYNPTKTWIGDDNTQNLRNYFSSFRGTGWSYTTTTNTLTLFGDNVDWEAIKEFKETTEHVVFAEDYAVSSIPNEAFSGFSKLDNIDIPNVVTSIEQYAFRNCSSLASITLPEGLTSISNGAFNDCNSLTSITLPASVTSIGNEAFNGCSSLNSVEILSNGTSDDMHFICLGGSDDKTAAGKNVFPRDLATLIYDPNTTWIGDSETENLRYYFNASYIPTSIKPNVITPSTSRYYDLGGRPVSPESHKGVAVKLQDGKASLTTTK